MKYQGVVVLFKPNDKMLENIDSYIGELDKLYVVDNTPGADISSKFQNSKIKYIPLKENKGIAYALNVGAKEAINNGADWLLTMDQDSIFEDGAVRDMKLFIEFYKENPIMSNVIGKEYDKVAIVSPFHITERSKLLQLTGIDRPLLVMTSGNFVKLDAYQEVDGFKDWLFIDCVDFDFCLNLRKHGYEIVQLNCARLQHPLGDIIEKKFLNKYVYVDNHSAFRRYYITRNRHYIYDLYHNDFPIYTKLELKRTRKELLKIWLFEKSKIKKTKAIIRGYKDYKKGVKGDGNEK